MEVLTQQPGTDTWWRWPSVLHGILVAISDPSRCVVLLSSNPRDEVDELANAVRLIRRAAGAAIPIVVASHEPAGSWQDDLRMAGVSQIWMVERLAGDSSGRITLEIVRDARTRPSSRSDEGHDSGGRAPSVRRRVEGPRHLDEGALPTAATRHLAPGRTDAGADAGSPDALGSRLAAERG